MSGGRRIQYSSNLTPASGKISHNSPYGNLNANKNGACLREQATSK
jgi:hypothetical protein